MVWIGFDEPRESSGIPEQRRGASRVAAVREEVTGGRIRGDLPASVRGRTRRDRAVDGRASPWRGAPRRHRRSTSWRGRLPTTVCPAGADRRRDRDRAKRSGASSNGCADIFEGAATWSRVRSRVGGCILLALQSGAPETGAHSGCPGPRGSVAHLRGRRAKGDPHSPRVDAPGRSQGLRRRPNPQRGAESLRARDQDRCDQSLRVSRARVLSRFSGETSSGACSR